MKAVRKLLLIAIIAGVALVVSAPAEEVQGIAFELGGLKASVTPPQGWKVQEGTPPTFFDMDGQKGSIQFVGSPMQMPDATFAAMHKAALDAGKLKVKSGDYTKAEEHALDGFHGVLTEEAAKDPSIRRLQWVAYGRGGYYSITLASTAAAFEGYRPVFQAFLASVKFAKK